MTVEKVLKGHDLFRSLSIEQANQISKFSFVKKYQAGENIFEYNKPSSHVYMLMEGTVNLRLPASPADVSLVISKIEKGELFGLSPLLDSPRYTATGQCATDTEVLAIEAKPFRELLQSNCLVGFQVMSQVAQIYFERYVEILKNLQDVVSHIPLIR
jgi:CRP/FNR family cyclic AMP-dependent transcriptional regulator